MNLDSKIQPINFQNDIKYLKGVGPRRSQVLSLYNIFSISDLLEYYPRKYLDRTNIQTIRNTKIGDEAVIIGKIISLGVKSARRRKFFQVTISDSTGYVSCIWFNSIKFPKSSINITTCSTPITKIFIIFNFFC